MLRTLKCDKICKYVKISDKIFKNTTETIKNYKVIKNRPKQIILRRWNHIVCLELVSVLLYFQFYI